MHKLKKAWLDSQEAVKTAKENYDMSHLITRRYATVLSQVEQRENTARLKYLRATVCPLMQDRIKPYTFISGKGDWKKDEFKG